MSLGIACRRSVNGKASRLVLGVAVPRSGVVSSQIPWCGFKVYDVASRLVPFALSQSTFLEGCVIKLYGFIPKSIFLISTPKSCTLVNPAILLLGLLTRAVYWSTC